MLTFPYLTLNRGADILFEKLRDKTGGWSPLHYASLGGDLMQILSYFF